MPLTKGAQRVAVIDYGMGNLHSVASALRAIGGDIDVQVTADAEIIRSADRVIFPGVGAIRDCMAEIKRLQFDALVPEVIASGKPVIGICVGMQALMDRSEENGGVDCLGVLPGQVKFFGDPLHDADGKKLKVPHMGWNQVHQTSHALWSGIAQDSRFYFVHSYYIRCDKPELVAATAQYGVEIHAALARDNLFAVQFHPEKSSDAGLQLLKNFLTWDGSQ
ncbi:MAG: imidazole glycerol phosphate synthase subunit HisH [Spongiibacteraceae bacterium]